MASPNIRSWERTRTGLLKRLAKIGPFIKGSLVEIHRACGNPNCSCARGMGHSGWYLTYKYKAKTQTLYVPVDLKQEVQAWVAEHQKLRLLMTRVDEMQKKIIRRYVKEKRRKAKKKR